MGYERFRVGTSGRRKLKTKGRFLKGPIPLVGIKQANELPGKAGQVYLLIWYVAGLRRSHEQLPITSTRARSFGLHDRTVRRGLRALEEAGLIRVNRSNRAPRVDIIEIETNT